MLSSTEVTLLSTLDGSATLSELTADLGHSKSYVSRLVDDLEEKGLVETDTVERAKVVRLADTAVAGRYRTLTTRHAHVDFSGLLGGSAVPILYYLDEPRTAAEIAESTGLHQSTVHRTLGRFVERGIVGKTAGRYALNEGFEPLAGFAQDLVSSTHQRAARGLVADAAVIWESLDGFLFATEHDIDGEHPDVELTGLTRFADYGLPFFTTGTNYYFYSAAVEALEASDLVCHALVIDDGSRTRQYCLLLIRTADVDFEVLTERASRYGVSDAVEDLLTYLKTRGGTRSDRLPPWDEFERLAGQYEVPV